MWNEIYFVKTGRLTPEYVAKYEGWQDYRIMYYTPDEDYPDLEKHIWLPSGFNIRLIEDEIDRCVSNAKSTEKL